MAELLVIRHGQASFGADNYDRLSELGRRQSERAGEHLRDIGWTPDRVVTGTLRRQTETLAAMGLDAGETHPGFDEYDFHDLLHVRFGGEVPDPVRSDRKTHFRTLRETVLDWQTGGCAGARETFAAFEARVDAARASAVQDGAERVLVVSSGGVIGQLARMALEAPAPQMMALNLQVRNTSLTRFITTPNRFFLHEFNALPHLSDAAHAHLVSYS